MAVTISLAITQNSQSVADNTSNVTVKATVKWTGGSYNATGECTGSITIDGKKYSFSGLKFNTGKTTTGSQTIMTKTVNVGHNSDGTKTLSCSTSFYTGVSSGTITISASKVLTTISRKSTLSASNGTLGTAQTLTISRKSSSFTHTIKYTCGSASGTICTKTTETSVSFTPPLSLANQNTTGTSVSVKFEIITYSGSTNIGSNTKTITCSIPSSVKPSCSISVSDAAGYSVYVKGCSKFKITVTPTTAYGSAIDSYSVKANGATYTTATVTTGVLASSGTLTITATVKDKRGRTGTATKTVTVYDKSTLSTVNGTLDNLQYLSISSGHSSFKHTIKYTCGSASGTIITKTSDTVNIPFTPPASLASQNTTGTSLSVKLTITTYCDDKSIGSNTKTITCSIPDTEEFAPSVKMSVEDSTGFDAVFGGMVKGHSKMLVKLSFTPAYGADIVAISTSVLGVKYNEKDIDPSLRGANIDVGTVTTANDFTITTTVTDERGITRTATHKVTNILDYSAPQITKLTVGRCNEDGTPNEAGTDVLVTYSASITSLNNLNSCVARVFYKKTTESNYAECDTWNGGSFSNRKCTFPAETGSSYNVLLTVDDSLKTTTKSTTASTAFTIMHFHKDGQGMAIGKVSEDITKEYLDMGIHTVMQNNKYLCGMSLTTKDDTRAPTPVRMLYLNANNNTILGYGGYAYGYGTTNIYGQRVNLGVKLGGVKDGAEAFFKPYYEKGDVITDATWTGAGFVSASSGTIYFSIPLSKPIVGSPTVVITSTGGGIRGRQNEHYTHGSSSENYAIPTEYTASANSGNFIQVSAKMNSTTYAINNAPIGVQWKGTITFE